MSLITRIALCQIACHPAIYTAHQMWLEEPFVSENPKNTLSFLSINGFGVDDLLEICKERYINWHRERLKSILHYIEGIEPAPDLLVFPEGAIPYQCLDLIQTFHKNTGTAVFSGTHTLQNLKNSKKSYRSIGVKEKTLERLIYKKTQTSGVAPIFIDKKIHLIPKQIHSPFEQTDISNLQTQQKPIVPFKIRFDGKKVSVLLLICSEALNFSKIKVKGDYEIVAILSYDSNPKHFDSISDMLVSNKRAVIYCNDGKYGGSGINLPIDERRPIWWFSSSLHGKLPIGDSLLVADIDCHNLPVQVGIAAPMANFKLVQLNAIVYSEDRNSCHAALSMDEIKKLTDNNLKAKKIDELLRLDTCNILQQEKFSYLSKIISRGHSVEGWWDAIGNDLIVKLPSLHQIEKELSLECFSKLSEDLIDYDTSKKGYDGLRGFLKNAKAISGKALYKRLKTDKSKVRFSSVIDRDDDAKSIVVFFDNNRQKIAQISGLQQIGKTAVIEKALQHCTYKRILEINIYDTSSAEYILLKLFSDPVYENKFDAESILKQVNDDDFVDVLDRLEILWIHNAENLVRHGAWRTAEISTVINKLLQNCIDSNCKIIFETRVNLPLEIDDPNLILKRRIYGMDRNLLSYGIAYFDYQLRRVDLSPNEIDIETKKYIVNKVGGHPSAMALCADAIVDEGLIAVSDYLKTKKGFYLNFVNEIINSIDLNESEKTILKLLSGCRLSIQREAILQSFDYVVNPFLKNLIELCLIEVDANSLIRIAGLLRHYFDIEELDPKLREKFHLACGAFYKDIFEYDKSKIEYAIESDVHNGLAGQKTNLSGFLFDSQFEISKKYFDKHDYKNAKTILDKIPDEKKTHDILRLSALVDAKCNQFDAALRNARKVFTTNRKDTYLLSQIARTALSQGRDDIAESLIDTAKAANMEDTSILIVSGRMLLRRNDLSSSEIKFRQAVKLTKRNPWPFFYLGKIYMRFGEMDKAIDILFEGEEFIYNNSIRNERALAAIKTQLGIAYLLNDNLELAEITIKGLYQERRKDPEVIRAYAMITIKMEGIDKAFEAFQKLSEGKIRSRFDRAQFHLYYGLFYLGLGDIGNASAEFSKAHQADKNNVYIMMKLAKTYYDLAIESHIDGEVDIAKAYAKDCALITKKILEFDSDNQTGKYIQIDLYSKFRIELSKI